MIDRVRHWLTPPVFLDSEVKTRRAALLNYVLLAFLALVTFILIGALLGQRTPLSVLITTTLTLTVCLVLLAWLRRDGLTGASIGLMATGLIVIAADVVLLGTVRAPVTAVLVLLVITAGLLFDLGGMIVMAALCSLTVAGLIGAENAGWLPRPDLSVNVTQWATYTAVFAWAGSLMYAALRLMNRALLRAESELRERQRAEAALRQAQAELEQRVEDRTAELTVANDRLQQELSERRQAEAALRESEARFRSYFELPLAGRAITSPDKGWLDVNATLCDMLGYTKAELMQMTWAELTHPDDIAADLVQFNRVMAGEIDGYSLEKRFLRKDGRIVYTQLVIQCLRRLDRSVDYFVALIQDTTERRLMEEALRESEERYRELVENANDIVYTLDLAGNFTSANRAAERITGYTRPEILALNLTQVVSPDDFALARQMLQNKVAHGQSTTYSLEIQARDGRKVPLELSTRLIYQEGQLIGSQGIARDITERKRAEEALRESQSLYYSLVEVSPLCICRKDLAGRFTFANQRFLEESRITLDGLIGKTDFDIHPPELAEKYRRDDRAVIASEQVHELIEERALVNGETQIVQTIKTPIRDGAGQINGVQISFWDITARQRAEEAMRELNATLEQRVADRTAELQAANLRLTELDHLKDEFLSRTSHELRTPLTSIKIYLELLETAKPEKRDKYLQTLKREADRLHILIEDVLMFSQLNLYTRPAALESIDLNNLIEGRLTTWQKLSAGHDLAFQLNLARDLPRARTDGELILQALTRLITNAVNYTPAGSITVSTARVDEGEQRWFTISVKDTGPGITPDDLPHIFERFYRGRAAADYRTPGTGVGLSISREIAGKLGGRLTVETQVGAGSTFILWLPVANEPADAPSA